MNVAVVGEGVVGTSVALAIRRAHSKANITIFSDREFEQTTSYGPAGIFLIFLPNTERWAKESFAFWAQIERNELAEKTGVHLISGYCQSNDKGWIEEHANLMSDIVYDWKWLTDRQLGSLFVKPYSYGAHCTTYAAQGRLYVPWLRAQLVAESGHGLLHFRRQQIGSLQELIDSDQFRLVVNCAGLDGGRLAGDDGTSVYPNRGIGIEVGGQGFILSDVNAPFLSLPLILKVEVTGHSHFNYWEDGIFCLPFVSNGRFLIGTVRQDNCWQLEVTEEEKHTIWKRFVDLQPNFRDAKIVSTWCGLRPNRHGGVRLEHQLRTKSNGTGTVHVIHNYGHGSNGILLSWGCASEVVRLIGQQIVGEEKSHH